MAAVLDQNGFIEEEKKIKKKKHKKLESDDREIDISDGAGSEKRKSKKKRKASDEETSETSSDGSDPVLDRKVAVVNGSALKKSKLMKGDEDGEVIASREEAGAANPNPNAVSKFRISKVLREKLKSKGIESLFPIQAMTFDLILDGADLVGRARTGQVEVNTSLYFPFSDC